MAAVRPAARALRRLGIGALLATVAIGVYTRPQTSSAAVAVTEIGASAQATGLPAEFRAIRPADLDGSVPPIPPSELWPAQ